MKNEGREIKCESAFPSISVILIWKIFRTNSIFDASPDAYPF